MTDSHRAATFWNEPLECMARDDMRRLQVERLRWSVAHAERGNPVYRERLHAAGVDPARINSLDDLARLPFTTKGDLRDHYPFGLFAAPLDQVVRLHASSGTRGKPTVVGYTRQDLAIWSEVMARSLLGAGVGPGTVLHNAYGYGLFTGGLGFHMGGELLGCQVLPISGGNTARQIMMLRDLGSQALACTPSYALNIAGALADQGVSPDELSLRVGLFGAEPWSEAMRRSLEEGLGISALDVYGLSEVIGPGVSAECLAGRNGLHVHEDHFLAEIVDPQSGEPRPDGSEGELVFTSLTKEALPILRYRTGDISALDREPCVCGRTSVRMARIKGRYDDMLIIRGINLYPSEVERALLSVSDLAPHYQIVIRRESALDQLDVQVEVIEPISDALGLELSGYANRPESVQALSRRVQDTLYGATGLRMIVTLRPPRAIPRSEGKAIRVIDMRNQEES